MNYYEHHIRDWDTATSHLTWEEDLAYTRLIRWYYRKEKPVPADIKEACRQVRAVSKAQCAAVAAVLKEFFELREDGWHNETCDQAIKRYLEGEPEREVKKANEDNRMKRHRDERARLFKVITDAGLHAPWNIGMAELRDMVGRVSATEPVTQNPESVTSPVTAPATPATATQSPITNHQSPVLKPYVNDDSSDSSREPEHPSETMPVARNVQIALLLRAQGVQATAQHPTVCVTWGQDALVTDDVLNLAIAKAKAAKPKEQIPVKYLQRVIEGILADLAAPPPSGRPPITPAAPRKPPSGMDPKGLDESYDAYNARIAKAESDRRKGQKP